ncbi:hypothetical protein BC832DRAFT_620299 [Gaertneriomyces semiglobifer]|nr:hypothetical protein BC832DRAFT_620299 [Gaertneriomyces semiglobifer]
MPPKFGGAPQCPRCNKAVYMAEQITGPGGLWHKSCLTCKECNRRLDSTNLTEREAEAYCKSCYGKLFGPKGYGFGGGSGVLSTDSTITDAQRFSPSPSPSSSRQGSNQNLFNASPRGSNTNLSSGGGAKVKYGGSDNCPRCGKAVYFAEQMLGPMGVKYHKMCFRCTECNKMLDSTTMAEKEGVIYCRPCHGKNFGPKGYGYGGGAGVLQTS